jgi:hypothetical protein
VPYGLYIDEAADIVLQNFRARWGKLAGIWQHALFARNTADLTLSHFDAASSPTASKGEAAIHCVRCSGIALRACCAGRTTTSFLSVSESPPNATVRLVGNDFTNAQDPVSSDAAVLESGNLGLGRGGPRS